MTEPITPRNHRLWLPLLFLALTGAAIAVVRLLPELERNLKNWATAVLTLLGLALVLTWFLLLSRFTWKVRLLGALAVAAVVFGVKASVRRDGTMDGTGLPRLAWRWSPKPVREPLSTVSGSAEVTPAPGARDVPDFFGPQRDGVVRDAGLLPDWKSQPPKELWRQGVGAGWSAFAVVGGRAVTQEQRGEEEAVTCYELLSGRLLWMHTHQARFEEWQGGPGPRATPVIRDGRVYAIGGTGILDCLELETGREVWSRDVLKEFKMGNITWGISGSPLVFDDTVVVTGGRGGHALLAFRASSGEPLWQAAKDDASYVSPSLVTLLGRRLVLSVNAKLVTAHVPETGAEVLSYSWAEGIPAKGSQPVIIGDNRIFLSAGYHAGCALLEVTAAEDGKLAAAKVWENLKMKTQFNSVALRDGHVYGLDDNKLACLDIASGERLWKEGRFGSGQSLLVDDLVIVQSEPGDVVLCAVSPERYKEVGRIPALNSKTWNHPLLAGRYLLVRNDREAVCYELPVK
jgi:outer membrane protein assembly factor BamB